MNKNYWRQGCTDRYSEHGAVHSIFTGICVNPVLLWSCWKTLAWLKKFIWEASSPAFHTCSTNANSVRGSSASRAVLGFPAHPAQGTGFSPVGYSWDTLTLTSSQTQQMSWGQFAAVPPRVLGWPENHRGYPYDLRVTIHPALLVTAHASPLRRSC